MKTNKKREQFEMANTLFEIGMDFNIIEAISGVSASEVLLHKINLIEFEEESKKDD